MSFEPMTLPSILLLRNEGQHLNMSLLAKTDRIEMAKNKWNDFILLRCVLTNDVKSYQMMHFRLNVRLVSDSICKIREGCSL